MGEYRFTTSFWAEENPPRSEALRGEMRADVAIIGAGYAGLSAAYHMKEADPSLEVVVLEKEHAGFGASGRNVGVVNPTLGGRTSYFAKHYGLEAAKFMVKYLLDGVDYYAGLLEREGISEHFEWQDCFIVALEPRLWDALGRYAERHHEVGLPCQLVPAEEARQHVNYPEVYGAIALKKHGLVQPYQVARGLRGAALRQGVKLYEGTPVQSLTPGTPVELHTLEGRVKASWAVLCTNAYTGQLGIDQGLQQPFYSHQIITEPLDGEKLASLGIGKYEIILDAGLVYFSARLTNDKRLLFGGGEAPMARDQEENSPREFRRIHEEMVRRFPCLAGVKVDCVWAGPISLTPSGLPVMGSLPGHPNIITSLGYNGVGVLLAVLMGRAVRSLILGHKDDHAEFQRLIAG